MLKSQVPPNLQVSKYLHILTFDSIRYMPTILRILPGSILIDSQHASLLHPEHAGAFRRKQFRNLEGLDRNLLPHVHVCPDISHYCL